VHEVVLGRTPSTEQTHRYWAAERNGLVIGALTAVADEGWELRDLAVLPQYDAIEIGSALLRHAEAELEGPLWSATPQIPEVFRTWQDDGTGVLRWPG
jgi:N-acetylglutamate synthase-like GNAT family acetyltransferase